jgi:uncharacterized protein YecT (DUF1311 family)
MRTPIEPLMAMLFTVLAFSAPAAADDAGKIKACLKTEHDAGRSGRDCIGSVSDPCLQKPGNETTQSMVECVDGETQIWDELLNADYQRLLGSLEGKAAESVRQAERAWIAARDADCKVPYDIYEGGTMARLDGANCVLDHTATRVLQLHVWQDMAKPE